MPRGWSSPVVAALLAVLAVAGAAGGGLALIASSHSPASAPSHGSGPAIALGEHPLPTSGRAVAGSLSAAPRASPTHDAVLSRGATGRGGARPMLFPPNPRRFTVAPGSASRAYAATPAPMGLSDLGVGANGSYAYGTDSFEGELTVTSLSAFTPTNSTNLSYPSPDWVLLQLDAVAVNVTLPPATSNGTFWVQNGLHLNGSTVQLEDDIWNFSGKSSGLPSSTLEGKGSILYGEVYSAIGPTFSVTMPLTIMLFDNITTAGGHTIVRFGYSISGHGGNYDIVTFNGSTAPNSQFRVDGSNLTAGGLLYDAEFVLGGNGEGTNANIVALSAKASLFRNEASSYLSVPSAFDFGVDASETVLGVAVAYADQTAQLTAGPSFLNGLWNTNGPNASRLAPFAASGWIKLQITVDPSYAILFATNLSLANGPLVVADYSYAPTNRSGILDTDLPPPSASEPYVFNAWADGYDNATLPPFSASMTATLSLPEAHSEVDAPVYLQGTEQATELGEAHAAQISYVASLGTIWLNASKVALAAPFLKVNEFDYPMFPLVSALYVNLSIDVNGFVQGPTSFNYTSNTGQVTELANWTQGYFFYYGDGKFTVQNTTIEGNTTLAYSANPVYPPSTVEFYHTSEGAVANLTARDDATGVTIVGALTSGVTDLAVETGALGVMALDASGVTISHASASGEDREYTPSTLAFLSSSSSISFSSISVADLAYGVDANHTSDLSISGLTVTSDATGLEVNASSSGTVTDLTVGGGGVTSAGSWTNSSSLSFASVDVNGSGLELQDDSSVTVTGGTATAFGSAVVSSFNGSTLGTFRDLEAVGGANAVSLVNCTNVNASAIVAKNGSVGTYVAQASSVSGTDYASSNQSVGLLVGGASTVTFSSFTTSDQSVGAYVANSSKVELEGVVANNTSLGMSDYFANATEAQLFPIAGIGLSNDTTVTVGGVSAIDYPFAVWSNDSTYVDISKVISLYGFEAVALNYTNASNVTEVFAFADEATGISVQNCTETTVAQNTLELSGGVGLSLTNGSKDTIKLNNFVGNNGSSVGGGFNVSHLQAFANFSSGSTFNRNYWTDRSGSAYAINSTTPVKDLNPLSGFSGTYLEFNERGLPAGWNWTVVLSRIAYTSNVSVLYLPGWALANGPLSFTIVPILDYPPHPPQGSLSWDAASQTQTIIFGSPSSPSSGPPLWMIAAIAGFGLVVVVAVVLAVKRRRPRRGLRDRSDWSPDHQA